MHYRKIIRDNIVNKLKGNITYNAQAVPVHQTRVIPYWKIQLPAIAVYMLQDTSEHKQSAPREYWRDLQLVVQIIIKEEAGKITDDIIDEIAEQIELIFFKDPWINDKVDDSDLVSTAIAVKEEGDILYSAASMIWNTEYRSEAPPAQESPTVEDFELANIGIGIDGISIAVISASVDMLTIQA